MRRRSIVTARARIILRCFLLALVALSPVAARAKEIAYVGSSIAGVVTAIDVSSGATLASIAVGEDVADVAASADGTKVYVAVGEDLVVIDTTTNSIAARHPVGLHLRRITVAPAGDRVYIAADAAAYAVFDTASARVDIVPFQSDTLQVLVSPDERMLYILNEGFPRPGARGGEVAIVDAESGVVRSNLGFGTYTPGLSAIAPAGDQLYVPAGGWLGLLVFEAPRGTKSGLIDLGGPADWVVGNATGERLYAGQSGQLRIVDRASGEEMRVLDVAVANAAVVEVSDGRLLALSQQNSAVLILDPADSAVDTPVVGALPVPPQAEAIAIADVPQTSTGGGGCDAAPTSAAVPGLALLALAWMAMVRRRGQSFKAATTRSTASPWRRPVRSTTISAQRR